ncbi:MAG: 6-phosphogluconolactonase [Polaribacter sp.]
MNKLSNLKTFSSDEFINNSALALKNSIEELLENSSTITIALSGGNSPLPVYEKLSTFELEWNRITFFLVDERCVPNSSSESNYGNIKKVLFNNIDSSNFPVIKTMQSFKKCADNYQQKILDNVKKINNIPSFDLIILGMGLDGHIASLFPKTKALNEDKNVVVLNDVPQLNTQRITMTFPLIMNAKKLVLLIKGEEKKKVFIDSLTQDLPVSFITPKLDIILN